MASDNNPPVAPDVWLPIFRSKLHGACNERAFMLAAVSIASEIMFDGSQFVVRVSAPDVPQALTHLEQYELERRSRPPPPPPPLPRLPHAWVGCVVYALTLVAVGLMVSNGLWRLDAFEAGEADAVRMQSGQWWRAWTALTLHLDGAHLTANLGAGIWFGYLAARQIGSGISWLLIVTGAAAANLIEALLGPPTHQSVGASTAVFTALGLLAAHSWRLRAPLIEQWAQRWAPLVAGVALLGWFGAGNDEAAPITHTDVVAHVLGFLAGIALGVVTVRQRVLFARLPQWLAGLLAAGSIAIAWTFALLS